MNSAHNVLHRNTQAVEKAPPGVERAASAVVRNVSEVAGRVLLASLFLASGLGKIGAYAATAGYMSAAGVPAALLPLVIVTEVLGGAAIIAGWQTRVTALAARRIHAAFGASVPQQLRRSNSNGDVLEERVDRGRVPAARGQRRGAAQRRRPQAALRLALAGRVSMSHRILSSTTSSIGSKPTRAYTAFETGFATSVYKKQLRRPESSNCRAQRRHRRARIAAVAKLRWRVDGADPGGVRRVAHGAHHAARLAIHPDVQPSFLDEPLGRVGAQLPRARVADEAGHPGPSHRHVGRKRRPQRARRAYARKRHTGQRMQPLALLEPPLAGEPSRPSLGERGRRRFGACDAGKI